MKTIQHILFMISILFLGISVAQADTTIQRKSNNKATRVQSVETRQLITTSLKNIFTEISDDSEIQINETPFTDLYEIIIEGNHILYTNPKAEFLLMGDIFDMSNKVNITEQRASDLRSIEFDSLPLDRAIKIVKGTGERVIVTFEDPNCYYCQKLNKELAEIENTTHYVFLLPILSDKSVEVATQIWCAENPAEQWTQWITTKETPKQVNTEHCDLPFEFNSKIAGEIGLSGTPTIIFKDGSIIGGLIPKAAIQARMDEAK